MNPSSFESASVICPIINDKQSSNSVLTTVHGFVRDFNWSADAHCQILEHIDDWTGWGAVVSTSGSLGRSQDLQMVTGGNLGIALLLFCRLPASNPSVGMSNMSGIDRYTVIETN